MTFCKRRVCRASAKDELQTIGRPPSQLGGAGRAADCSQFYALQFYTARCKHSALRAPCSQRFTPESGALRPTLMPEASNFFLRRKTVENIILNGTFTLANENYVVVYFRCSLGLNPPVQAG